MRLSKEASPSFRSKTDSKVRALFENGNWAPDNLDSFWTWLTEEYFTRQNVTEEDFR